MTTIACDGAMVSKVYGIVANVVHDRVLRHGAKVWICYDHGDAQCPLVIGMSKGGRIVKKYTNFKRLTHFRAAWIPEHLRNRILWVWERKDEADVFAAHLATIWTGVQFFNRDGTCIQDGVSTNEAFARVKHLPILRMPR